MEALAMQMFDVDISTIITKTIRVKAQDLQSAQKIARKLDEKGITEAVKDNSSSKSYSAYLLCPRCGKHTNFYYEAPDSIAYCLPCYREITNNWRRAM